MWCLVGMLCVYAMFLIALSSIALAVLLALGPLFIAMLLFEATKRFFSAWIAQLANYALITILTVMVSALLLQIVQSYAAQTAARGAAILTVDALNMMLIAVLVFLILRQVMPIAAGLAGGLALNSFGTIGRGLTEVNAEAGRCSGRENHAVTRWIRKARWESDYATDRLLFLLLAACSSHGVRCDAHLQPINPPAPPASERRMNSSSLLQQYFREAESWDADRTADARRSAQIAWRAAAAGWTCAVFAAAAIVVLMPLKRIEPFVVRVDNSTGIVDVVPMNDARATPQEAVTRYFLTHYLTVCERFNFATAESDYEECGAFHSPQRNQVWYALWTATNPASPLNLHKDGSSVRVQVKSVSFFTRASGLSDLAQIRYVKAARQSTVRRKHSATGSPRSSTPTPIRRGIRRSGAGIRWASRSSTSGRSPRF